MRTSDRRSRGERGTSTLEVAGLAPLVLFVAFLLVNGGIALYAVTATETAARQAARERSLGGDYQAAAAAALPGWLEAQAVPIEANGVEVSVDIPDIFPGTDLVVSRQAILP